jgi:uncharacterized phage protein gp47/JayE
MTDFGVTQDGFVLKTFDAILTDALNRAVAMFGADVDLTSTSPLRKLIEAGALEDAELWQRLEDFYYGAFISTATGDSLDLLADDVGLARREEFASGDVTLTLGGAVAGRTYVIPEGTVLLAPGPGQSFATPAPVQRTAAATPPTVAVTAFTRGPDGDVGAGTITAIDPGYTAVYLADFGTATVSVTNGAALTGGLATESDDALRGRVIGISRTLWTEEAAQQAVLDVDGVVDVLLSDPLGGVDVSQSYFGEFDFAQRLFSAERGIGEPYQFSVVVAYDFAWPWRTTGSVPGVFERVTAVLDTIRPAGVHPNVISADHIDVGVRATVTVEPGYDAVALLSAILGSLANTVAGLRLGSDVLFSQIMGAIVAEPGVIDVQGLHLRRYPPAFGRITFGNVPYQTGVVEAGIGQNLAMGPTELPVLRTDSTLQDLTLVQQ